MTDLRCTTFPAIVWNCADENGCIRWSAACQAAKTMVCGMTSVPTMG